ncbi:MAG: sulfite exporter TauE/SafE family protein [Dermatophilaceae bacterium]
MAWWIAPIGVLVGLVLGALGGGGAVLAVPVFVYILGQTPAQATAGSLVVVGLSALVGVIPHARAGHVRFVDGIVFGVLGVLGSLAGSLASTSVPGHVLMTIFAILLLAVAGLMIRKLRRKDEGAGHGQSRSWAVRIVAATGVGLLTGLLGVGGGFVVVPVLMLVLGFPMAVAVGTSLVVIAVNALSSLAFRASVGLDIDWTMTLTFAAFAVLGGLFGSRVGKAVGQRRLSIAFVVMLVLVAGFVAFENIPELFQAYP